MNIIEKYIETNKSLLDDLVANDPTLASGVIDALAVLNNYINTNNIEFTEQEEQKILVPADLTTREKLEETERKKLEIAEKEAKLAQKVVENIEVQTDTFELCTYFWERSQGDNRYAYFLYGQTSGFNQVVFITSLTDNVFDENPTFQNGLLRVLISDGYLRQAPNGIFEYKYPQSTLKERADKTSAKSLQSEAIKSCFDVLSGGRPILILDEDRKSANDLLVDPTNPIGVIDNPNLIQSRVEMTGIWNTLIMVAWAEHIDLDFDVYGSFYALANYYQTAIQDSISSKLRCYMFLTRNTNTESSEIVIALGSPSAEDVIRDKGADNAFIIAIIVDGVFQKGINPYMFKGITSQATIPQVTLIRGNSITQSQEEIDARDRAIRASKITTEQCYVLRMKDGTFGMEVGDEDALIIANSPMFKSLVAVYQGGNVVVPSVLPTPTTSTAPKETHTNVVESHTEEINDEDLKNLEPIELHIKDKDVLKTDFSLLDDINFDDEE